jgi:hypothetical protein
VGFGKENGSILVISYMLYTIEREALLEARKISSCLLECTGGVGIEPCVYAARSPLRFLVVSVVKWGLLWLGVRDPCEPRMLPSTTAGESSNRARSCTYWSFMVKGDNGTDFVVLCVVLRVMRPVRFDHRCLPDIRG